MAPRTVLITGCSDGGLGAALAVAFHKHGDRVLATARNPEKMASLKSQGIETLPLDVLSEDSIKACVEKVSSLTGGSLDILVNNAGAGYNMPILDCLIPEIHKQFELNVYSVVRTTQLFFPLVRNSTTKLIVNHTSINSIFGLPFTAPYTASKAAAAAFSEALRIEAQPFGVRVVDLKTGGTKSHFFHNANASATPTTLPETSLYLGGKESINKFISKGPDVGQFQDASVWARNVVKDLSKGGGRSAPYHVFRGKGVDQIWWAWKLIPSWWLDGMAKKLVGLDVAEKAIKEAEKKRTK